MKFKAWREGKCLGNVFPKVGVCRCCLSVPLFSTQIPQLHVDRSNDRPPSRSLLVTASSGDGEHPSQHGVDRLSCLGRLLEK